MLWLIIADQPNKSKSSEKTALRWCRFIQDKVPFLVHDSAQFTEAIIVNISFMGETPLAVKICFKGSKILVLAHTLSSY